MGYKSKLILLFIGIFISIKSSAYAQTVIIEEDFSDGDYTNNPTWIDSESKHIVNSSNRLQLDAPSESAEAVISTASTAAYGEWETYIELGFNPSGSNLSRFYIVADNQDLKGNVDGYFVQIGDTEDEVSLYRQDGNTITKIIDGTDGLVDSNPVTVRIQVTRGIDGNWELFADPTGGTSYNSQGTATDNTYAQSEFIGLFSDYTSTRSDLFDYDDIKITKVNPPLDIQNVTVADNQTIDAAFNLDVDPASVQTSDFTITPNVGNPDNISTSGNIVQLTYNNPIPGGEYTLTVSDIDDNEGNTIDPNTDFGFQFFDSYTKGDIIINEFAYDYPTTINEEYIELRNTSEKYLNLADWQIADNNSSSGLGPDPIPIEPDSFLVISADTAELRDVFGDRAYHESSFPALNNTGNDAVHLIGSDGTTADSLTYNSDWGGTDVALERRSASAPSTYKENWGDSPNPDGGTPGTVNEVSEDNTPPKLTGLNILSTQTLQVVFNERLDQSGNYGITNSSISSVDQTAADTIELSLGSDLQNAQEYTLSIEDAKDIFGNTIAPTDTSFTYYEPSPVDSSDVAINEFMYDPPSGDTEYIELYNHSDKSLDIQDWTLSDNREDFEATITTEQFIIPPDSFVVIAPDNTIEMDYPDIALVTMSSFPALNNGGDQIIIRDQNGALLDSLEYTSNWGGDEVALERRTVDVSGTYQSNWGNSPNGFGTPGTDNEIEPDQIPPNLTILDIINSSSIEIRFDEPILRQSLENLANYRFSESIGIDQATANSDRSVSLDLASDLQNATDYQLTIDGIQDIYSNTLTNRDTTFTYYEISDADTGDVFLSEFMTVPPSGTTEYIELHNTTSKSFDLQGWTINDNMENLETITNQQVVLPPDSAIVIAPDRTLENDYPDIALIAMGSAFPSLNNSGDDIVIRTAGGTRIDSLQYHEDWGTDEVALERKSFELSAIYKSNWGDSPNGLGTPGTTNEINEDTEPPTLDNMVINNNQEILLTFSEVLDQSSAENTDNFIISDNLTTDAQFSEPDSILLTLDESLQNATNYNLSVENVADLFDNTISQTDTSFTYYEASPVDSGDVAINEFIYAPPSGNSEYIELYNHSEKSLDIQNWTLSDNREDFEATITTGQFIIPPDSFVVIAPDNTIESEYSDIALVTMGDFPALNNGGDQIIIRDQNGVLLDSLAYTSGWGGDEVALERRTVDVSGTYKTNWGIASNGFGTPGSTNEIDTDQTPPDLAAIDFLSETSIEIEFNEPVQQQTLEDQNNYQLSGSIEIDQATANGEYSVALTLTSALQNAVDYQLTIDGIQDIYSNSLSNRDTTFTYYEISMADSGDVFLSEFMSVPPSGSTEYIELRNTTTKSFNLQNWTINDNTGNRQPITGQQFVLPPDSAVVIAPDQTLITDFPDITLVSMGSSFPSLNNSGDDIVVRTGDGTLIDSLQYQDNWGTYEVALERRSFDLSAIYQSNWGEATNGFGTPGTQNEIHIDSEPPLLQNVTIGSSQKILLTFSEYLEKSSSDNPANFVITGNISVSDAHFAAPDSIFLTLNQNLQNASDYTLSIEKVEDLFNNAIVPIDTSFTFYEVSPVDSDDVTINEFMYAPPSGDTEYIELYNHSDKSLDIQNWTLSDNREDFEATITTGQFIIPPDSFVVIAPDNTIESEYSDIALVTMGDFPALNNGGDQIIIRDQNGVLLDSLAYTSGWGGDEVALERRAVDVSATSSDNWGNAPNGYGTPGSTNEIESDQTPPTFDNITAIDATTLELTFSENVTSESATNSENYQISPTIGIQLISAKNELVTLFLEQELTDRETYQVTASNISDTFGNSLSEESQKLEYIRIDEAQPGDIVINEILYDPGDSEKADFIELYNTSNRNFDVTEWVMGDFSGETTIEDNLQLKAGEYMVLTGNRNFAADLKAGAFVNGFPALNNNTPDAIYIRNQNGATIDSVRYAQSWGSDIDGTSLERKDPLAASNDASNWQSNNTENGISAGVQNITFKEDTNPPEIIFSKILPNNNYEVRFNEFIHLTDEVAFYYGNQQLTISEFDSTNASVIYLQSPSNKSSDSLNTTLRAENISDVKGNSNATSEVSIAQPMQNGDLVINEIMFNPLADSDDNQPDQTEYIELRNTEDHAISLEGLFLHDEPDENGDIRDIQPVSTTTKWVPPQGQVLVHAEEAADFDESLTANFFDLQSPKKQSILRADRASLSLASSDDAIYIADSTGATIDSVFYDQSWHNPNIIDTRGIALERITPDGPSNDESNWGSSVNKKGGTPNNENSIYQENGEIKEETGISFTPNPFSPDDDGHEDNLFINYTLDYQDYLMKVRIYDRYGRLVRTLADGEQAGFEGQLIWDGRKDDDSRNRIGIYIVVFEAYDSTSGGDKTFKKTVVLARKLN
ncbi:MAG: lamin tail domain-containing protein [Bacteroidota bacterium]